MTREISALHRSLSKLEYEKLLAKTLERWKKAKELKDFHDYFVKQWVQSDFSNWQLFHTPPGFASTNNPLEQYNAYCYLDGLLVTPSFVSRMKRGPRPRQGSPPIPIQSNQVEPIELNVEEPEYQDNIINIPILEHKKCRGRPPKVSRVF